MKFKQVHEREEMTESEWEKNKSFKDGTWSAVLDALLYLELSAEEVIKSRAAASKDQFPVGHDHADHILPLGDWLDPMLRPSRPQIRPLRP